eukprot:TRINITY_DN2687_c0_g3_i4.p1 TRINITY_DN2687_c0_g3~~TRINITY_DN2687_c0_g3_i4.p1  ORF type:complete len:1748 (+),score=645.29 TRINITY_DN2687_c0_g3_i4:211-5454(+)
MSTGAVVRLGDIIPNRKDQLHHLLEKLASHGLKDISKVLSQNNSVQRIKFDDFKLTNTDAVYLATALHVNSSLTNVSLGSNQVGNRGAAALADALLVNRFVQVLNLANNLIGDAGVLPFRQVLGVNTTLTTLSLRGCPFGIDGLAALADGLQANTTLLHVDLSGVPFGDRGAALLAAALRANRTLNSLALNYCAIHDSGASAIADTLEANLSDRNSGNSLSLLEMEGNHVSDALLFAIRKLIELDCGSPRSKSPEPSARSAAPAAAHRGAPLIAVHEPPPAPAAAAAFVTSQLGRQLREPDDESTFADAAVVHEGPRSRGHSHSVPSAISPTTSESGEATPHPSFSFFSNPFFSGSSERLIDAPPPSPSLQDAGGPGATSSTPPPSPSPFVYRLSPSSTPSGTPSGSERRAALRSSMDDEAPSPRPPLTRMASDSSLPVSALRLSVELSPSMKQRSSGVMSAAQPHHLHHQHLSSSPTKAQGQQRAPDIEMLSAQLASNLLSTSPTTSRSRSSGSSRAVSPARSVSSDAADASSVASGGSGASVQFAAGAKGCGSDGASSQSSDTERPEPHRPKLVSTGSGFLPRFSSEPNLYGRVTPPPQLLMDAAVSSVPTAAVGQASPAVPMLRGSSEPNLFAQFAARQPDQLLDSPVQRHHRTHSTSSVGAAPPWPAAAAGAASSQSLFSIPPSGVVSFPSNPPPSHQQQSHNQPLHQQQPQAPQQHGHQLLHRQSSQPQLMQFLQVPQQQPFSPSPSSPSVQPPFVRQLSDSALMGAFVPPPVTVQAPAVSTPPLARQPSQPPPLPKYRSEPLLFRPGQSVSIDQPVLYHPPLMSGASPPPFSPSSAASDAALFSPNGSALPLFSANGGQFAGRWPARDDDSDRSDGYLSERESRQHSLASSLDDMQLLPPPPPDRDRFAQPTADHLPLPTPPLNNPATFQPRGSSAPTIAIPITRTRSASSSQAQPAAAHQLSSTPQHQQQQQPFQRQPVQQAQPFVPQHQQHQPQQQAISSPRFEPRPPQRSGAIQQQPQMFAPPPGRVVLPKGAPAAAGRLGQALSVWPVDAQQQAVRAGPAMQQQAGHTPVAVTVAALSEQQQADADYEELELRLEAAAGNLLRTSLSSAEACAGDELRFIRTSADELRGGSRSMFVGESGSSSGAAEHVVRSLSLDSVGPRTLHAAEDRPRPLHPADDSGLVQQGPLGDSVSTCLVVGDQRAGKGVLLSQYFVRQLDGHGQLVPGPAYWVRTVELPAAGIVAQRPLVPHRFELTDADLRMRAGTKLMPPHRHLQEFDVCIVLVSATDAESVQKAEAQAQLEYRSVRHAPPLLMISVKGERGPLGVLEALSAKLKAAALLELDLTNPADLLLLFDKIVALQRGRTNKPAVSKRKQQQQPPLDDKRRLPEPPPMTVRLPHGWARQPPVLSPSDRPPSLVPDEPVREPQQAEAADDGCVLDADAERQRQATNARLDKRQKRNAERNRIKLEEEERVALMDAEELQRLMEEHAKRKKEEALLLAKENLHGRRRQLEAKVKQLDAENRRMLDDVAALHALPGSVTALPSANMMPSLPPGLNGGPDVKKKPLPPHRVEAALRRARAKLELEQRKLDEEGHRLGLLEHDFQQQQQQAFLLADLADAASVASLRPSEPAARLDAGELGWQQQVAAFHDASGRAAVAAEPRRNVRSGPLPTVAQPIYPLGQFPPGAYFGGNPPRPDPRWAPRLPQSVGRNDDTPFRFGSYQDHKLAMFPNSGPDVR